MGVFWPWFLHIAYASALYALGRQAVTARVADVLWCGWAVCLLFDAAGSGDLSIPFRALIDFAMGVWLLTRVRGRPARWAGLSFIATMMVTVLVWALGATPARQIDVLDGLAFAQIGVIVWGAWGDGWRAWLIVPVAMLADILIALAFPALAARRKRKGKDDG